MIKELLFKIAQGNSSITELSREFNLEPRNVKDKLEMLVHMGYLQRIETCAHDQDKSDDNADERFECKHCLLAKNCRETSEERIDELVGYSLTKKGEKYLEQ
jgi:hypothetical protein